MNMRADSAGSLAKGVVAAVGDSPSVDVALCPPSAYLSTVAEATAGTPVEVGAQNVYAAEDGAFTGELNPGMLTDVGCRYVIIGHSERRTLMGETDAQVSEKLHAALAGNLIPIVCFGETLEQREADETEKVVETQIRGSLEGLDEVRAAGIVLAYEPVWRLAPEKPLPQSRPKKSTRSFASYWAKCSVLMWPHKFAFSTVAASSQAMPRNCLDNRISMEPWLAVPA